MTDKEHQTTRFELRQQLSSDSLFLIEGCVNARIEELRKTHWEIVALAGPSGNPVYTAIAAEQGKLEGALKQLQAVFLDQFQGGRAENDEKGRRGLVRVA